MSRTTFFSELLQTYRIQGSTVFGLIETNETTSLRFDLDHCDDRERCQDCKEYLLDVLVPRERFMIIEGAGERLRGSFSAGIPTADLDGDALRRLADCSFYDSRDQGIVAMILGGPSWVTGYPSARPGNSSVPGLVAGSAS